MKLKITFLAAGIISIFTWRVNAGTESEVAMSGRVGEEYVTGTKETEEYRQVKERIDRQTSAVRNRLHMAAKVSMGDDAGDDEIAELYRAGWIVDATVDEVETALKAAAATPSTEDDIQARILAHRASCRFFYQSND